MSFDNTHNSTPPLIRLRAVSKAFRLGQFIGLSATMKMFISFFTGSFLKKSTKDLQNSEEKFFAVDEISFEIRRSEKVGIVGLNGAGKSTLLKLISGIMFPTSGQISTEGRLIPLLGVGAGFDLEMTGRENIFIYGTVLGVGRHDLKLLTPEIMTFAEIDQFIDTPVKRYSKGMKARLAISIAFTLRPDILIVDEVLAVGDLTFRSKCMDKINDICDEGVALLFVSHSMSRLRALTDRCILLRNGKLVADGPTEKVLEIYLEEDLKLVGANEREIDDEDVLDDIDSNSPILCFEEFNEQSDNEAVFIKSVEITDEFGTLTNEFCKDDVFFINLSFFILDKTISYYPRVAVTNPLGEFIFSTIWPDGEEGITANQPGLQTTSVKIDSSLLLTGQYNLIASVFSYSPLRKHEVKKTLCGFVVNNTLRHPLNPQLVFPRTRVGNFYPSFEWKLTSPNKKP